MYRWEKAARGDRYEREFKSPSFSSTLLEEIYRSIDEGDEKLGDLRFYREPMLKKPSKGSSRAMEEEEERVLALPRGCLIEKWVEKKVTQKVITTKQQQKRRDLGQFERDCHYHHDQDALFFSTTSSSSDSSSGGFSSSDVDSIHGGRSKAAAFAPPPRPRPVRTSVLEKTERTRRSLLNEQRELRMFDDYSYNSVTDNTPRLEDYLTKSKSRASKIYSNLKKMKQPISPGAKFASFINSLFSAAGGTKKSKTSSSSCSSSARMNCKEEKKFKAGQESTCSSASSFSRSCLSKNSPSTRERLRNGVKRTVRFVDEDGKPSGHKSLNEQKKEEDQPSHLMSVSLPTAWKIGKSPSRKADHELKKSKKTVEDMAREFLKDYHQVQKQNDLVMRDVCRNRNRNYEDHYDYDDEDDDALSYSSSDLFELDHLAVIGNDRYRQELPVFETTRVDTNRAIANGLIM